jgi:hypothetical protein
VVFVDVSTDVVVVTFWSPSEIVVVVFESEGVVLTVVELVVVSVPFEDSVWFPSAAVALEMVAFELSEADVFDTVAFESVLEFNELV